MHDRIWYALTHRPSSGDVVWAYLATSNGFVIEGAELDIDTKCLPVAFIQHIYVVEARKQARSRHPIQSLS